MMRFLGTLLGLVVATIIIMLALPSFLPIDHYLAVVKTDVKEKTGRDMKVNGEVHFRLFPTIRLTLTDVTFANPPEFEGPNALSLDEIDIAVKLIPLFTGEIEVDRFILKHPKLMIETLADGRTNADVKVDKEDKPKKQKSGLQANAAKKDEVNLPAGLRLGQVKLIDGEVTIIDRRKDQRIKLDSINISMRLPSLADTFTLDGSVSYNKRPMTLGFTLTPFGDAMTGNDAKTTLTVHLDKASLDFTGNIEAHDGPVTGILTADVPTISEILTLAGLDQPDAYAGLGALSVKSDVVKTGNRLALTTAHVTLGPLVADGMINADLAPKTPVIDGRIKVAGMNGVSEKLSVPMILSGPINNISAKPDLEGLAKDKLGDPAALVNELVKLKSKGDDKPASAKDVIKGLLSK
jgi:AsmA protein